MILERTETTDFVLNKLNVIVIQINPNGEVTYVSPSVKKMLGFEPTDLLGNAWWQATRKNDERAEEMRKLFLHLVETDNLELLSAERQLFDMNGKKRWISWESSRNQDQQIISIGHDITRRKKFESRLIKTNLALTAKNKEILEGLHYARTIQHAILPSKHFYKDYFAAGFVFNQPKDIVSGDLFWSYFKNNKFYVALIDCTGHGVPGALMTILSNSLLKQVVKNNLHYDPAEVLYALDELLQVEYSKNSEVERMEGMDISLCIFDFQQMEMKLASANQSVLMVRGGEIIEFKGDRYPIGLYHDVVKQFRSHTVDLQTDDRFYLFSDGFVDQFGGEKEKKYTKKKLKTLIKNSQEINFSEQETHFNEHFTIWKDSNEQTDDVLLIGLKI